MNKNDIVTLVHPDFPGQSFQTAYGTFQSHWSAKGWTLAEDAPTPTAEAAEPTTEDPDKGDEDEGESNGSTDPEHEKE